VSQVIYPLYIVLDASGSMGELAGDKTRIEIALEVPSALLRLYEDQSDIVENLMVCVLTFNTEVAELLPLSRLPRLRDLPSKVETRAKTFISSVFRDLSRRIPMDVEKYSTSSKVMKPAVIIITDGIASPADIVEDRNSAWNALVPVNKNDGKVSEKIFNRVPQIIMIGVDTAKQDFLELYSTRQEYAMKIEGSLGIEDQLKLIVSAIKDSVANSMVNPTLNPDEDWLQKVLARKIEEDPDADDM
jgi:uncharacterized protein YegL